MTDPLPDSNPMLDTILRRASVRVFEDTDVPDEVVQQLVRCGQQAPFTGQMYTVIATRDPAVRRELASSFGSLAARGALFMLFCLDLRKLDKFIAARGRSNAMDDLSLLFLGIQDVAYFAENLVLAAEAEGLGSVFLGAAPWNASALRRLFDLPLRVYPVVGLVMGYPAERPGPRPRVPTKTVLHWDRYRDLGPEEIEDALQVMDEGLIRAGYYKNARIPLREGEDRETERTYGWGEHISRKYGQWRGTMQDLLTLLEEQGLKLRDE